MEVKAVGCAGLFLDQYDMEEGGDAWNGYSDRNSISSTPASPSLTLGSAQRPSRLRLLHNGRKKRFVGPDRSDASRTRTDAWITRRTPRNPGVAFISGSTV